MNNKSLKGIALILFGILLCAGSAEINDNLLAGYFPFSLIGIIVGAIGLWIVFGRNAGEDDK